MTVRMGLHSVTCLHGVLLVPVDSFASVAQGLITLRFGLCRCICDGFKGPRLLESEGRGGRRNRGKFLFFFHHELVASCMVCKDYLESMQWKRRAGEEGGEGAHGMD